MNILALRSDRLHCHELSSWSVQLLMFMSMGWDWFCTAATNGPIVHPPDDIRLRRATVEWYWQAKTEELGWKPVPVPFCPPQIPHGPTWAWTRASAVRGGRLIAWAMTDPVSSVTRILLEKGLEWSGSLNLVGPSCYSSVQYTGIWSPRFTSKTYQFREQF
jgi:hypothetical protein